MVKVNLAVAYQKENYFNAEFETQETGYTVVFTVEDLPDDIEGIFYIEGKNAQTLSYSELYPNYSNLDTLIDDLVFFGKTKSVVNQLCISFKKQELEQVEPFIEKVKEIVSKKFDEYEKQASILRKFDHNHKEEYIYDQGEFQKK